MQIFKFQLNTIFSKDYTHNQPYSEAAIKSSQQAVFRGASRVLYTHFEVFCTPTIQVYYIASQGGSLHLL